MKDRLEDRLGQLQIGNPDPALRRNVLAAAEASLDEGSPRTSWHDRLAAWRMEALLSGAIAAAVLLLLLMNGPAEQWKAPTAWIDEAAAQDIVEELDLNTSMESRYRTRLAWAIDRLAATRRIGDENRLNERDTY